MGLFNKKKGKRAAIAAHQDSHSGGRHEENGHFAKGSSSSKSSSNTPTMASKSSPRASIPDVTLPKAPDPNRDPVAYLRSIYAVRERSGLVLERAKRDQLKHFGVDMSKFGDTARYVVSIIKRDFADVGFDKIPPHGRWQHFDVGGRPRIDQLLQSWSSTVNEQERTRRLLDLFLVSVLLDAGAGTKWKYTSKENGKVYRRSEGLAVASLEMFRAGAFSSNPQQPCQVDSVGLKRLTVVSMAHGLQVSEENPIEGLQGRTGLLMRLSDALQNHEVFGVDCRPGNMLDYLLSHPTTQAASVPIVLLPTFWDMLMSSLTPIWPASRTQIDGQSIGDAWPLSIMPSHPAHPWESIVPFHKLTQWLCYSLQVPMTKLLNVHFAGVELMTGLPEYRNGGLLIDTGLMTLKEEDETRGLEAFHKHAKDMGIKVVEVVPLFSPDDDVIVEWRAATVGFLDELLVEVNNGLGLKDKDRLSLAQMLEAGTWKGGRELAEVSRPNTKEPPIMILSDGTVF
ncbi:hypothetical protein EJ08DRAFT_704145 [Tothia fuscella]|uniref:Uracil catabolism protein 4 n=1 Tax=Tothia fuscella TaxID=1048955 RepID=A0A9P4P3T8_9PEZI|nr:hypothetical protein EJ08DRAFT_704145 [Tothia fuscella]